MTNLSKVLTTGAGGAIGGYVDFGIKPSRGEMDVTNLEEVRRACGKHRPEAVLHLAGEADVDRAEREPERAYFLNSVGAYNLALAAKEFGFKLVYVSTSGVFDGRKAEPYAKNDRPNPINHYGHSKYLGEIAVQQLAPDYLIVRTDWIFGGGPEKDKKTAAKIIAALRRGEKEFSGVSDQQGSPTYAKDFVAGLKELLRQDASGVRHAVNSGPASPYEFIEEIIRLRRAEAEVKKVPAADFKTDAPRWKNKVLQSDVKLRSWREALREYLETEWQSSAI